LLQFNYYLESQKNSQFLINILCPYHFSMAPSIISNHPHIKRTLSVILPKEQCDFGTTKASLTNRLPLTPPEEIKKLEFNLKGRNNLWPHIPADEPVVAIIGVGYVGVHLVVSFALQYRVIAFDVSAERLRSLKDQFSLYSSVSTTTDATQLRIATHFLIAVPTNLLPDNSVDISYLRAAISTVELYARPGATVVIESSVAVGMTRKLLSSLMKERGLKAGMSPEVSLATRQY
jgi:hypothetical protein